jgi:3-oxoacyl-[acyl-carrier protein] reductase
MDKNMKYNILLTGSQGGLGKEIYKKIKITNHRIFRHSTSKDSDVNSNFNNLEEVKNLETFIKDNKINCLINNSGVYSNKEFTLLTEEEIYKIININLIAPILLTKYVYKNTIQNRSQGLIVNINSLAGKYPSYNESIYCASKFGLNGFGSSLSTNQKKSNVKVIDCFVGAMKTHMTINRDNYENLMEPSEIAEFIFNLIDSDNNYTISSFELRNSK